MRLVQFSDHCQVSARWRIFDLVVPVWEIRYADIAEIRPVGFGRRIRFRNSTGNWVIFRSSHRERIIQSFSDLGLNVIATPGRTKWLRPGLDRPY
jgi:hypothetical protein